MDAAAALRVNDCRGRNSKHAARPAAAVNETDGGRPLITVKLRLVQTDRWRLPFLPLAPVLEDGSDTPKNASAGMETGRGLPANTDPRVIMCILINRMTDSSLCAHLICPH